MRIEYVKVILKSQVFKRYSCEDGYICGITTAQGHWLSKRYENKPAPQSDLIET